MRIAVTYEDGQIFPDFDQTASFKVYEIDQNVIVADRILKTEGNGSAALTAFLQIADVNVLLCGKLERQTMNALLIAGIQVFDGMSGDADTAVEAFLKG